VENEECIRELVEGAGELLIESCPKRWIDLLELDI
jgi:hypothetical protein